MSLINQTEIPFSIKRCLVQFSVILLSLWLFPTALAAAPSPLISVAMHQTTAKAAPGPDRGFITLEQTPKGVLIFLHLHGLTPGVHGFHVHQNPSCANHGKAAGGHYDPRHTNAHRGPYDDSGHLGDLPRIHVNKDGQANYELLAPRLTLAELQGRSLMIHQGGDNYRDEPHHLGGGGARMVCGVINHLKRGEGTHDIKG